VEQIGLFDKPPESFEGVEPHELLREACKAGTYMVFLYGEGQGKRIARTHDSTDTGDHSIEVEFSKATEILKEYCMPKHCRHHGEHGAADVYVADRDAQKKRARKKPSGWIDLDKFC
jgi:hypothetical protein